MTIKTTAEGDAVATETIADRLRSVQTEPWTRTRYIDENDEAAWEVYNDSLFLKPTNAPRTESEPAAAAGGDEKKPADEDGAKPDFDLEASVPKLTTNWTETDYLEAVFKIKKPETVIPKLVVPTAVEVKEESQAMDVEPAAQPEAEEPKRVRSTRTRGGSSTMGAGSRRGGRAKAGASRGASSTVNID
jgi:DNA-directed RNA polymerase-3 subunit RPC5